MSKAENFVLVHEHDDGAMFCLGIYKNADEAYGHMILDIWDFAESYQEDGDTFEIGKPFCMDGDGGTCLEVRYKSHFWDEPETCRYYVLFEGEKDG